MPNKARFNVGFDLDNPEHAKAYERLMSYPFRRRSEFVIQAILLYGDQAELRNLIVDAVTTAMSDKSSVTPVMCSERAPVNKKSEQPTISTDALSFLESL